MMNAYDELAKEDDERAEKDSIDKISAENVGGHRFVHEAVRPKQNLKLLVGLVVFSVAILVLLLLSFDGSAVWSTTVDALVADPSLQGRRVRLEGTLVPGSLMQRDEPCEYRFQLFERSSVVNVRYPRCVIPDSFQDRPGAVVKVTVEGVLGHDNQFEATQVLAKCPSKYEQQGGLAVPVGE